MYDVIVVGGGVGGIGAAALLAKQGRKVLLLEQHDKVGGKCASHEKDGFRMPDFAHAFPRGSKGNCALISRMLGEEIAWGDSYREKRRNKDVKATSLPDTHLHR